jgi:ssDNA thymidine ADP-ribosyltransferase, DarT
MKALRQKLYHITHIDNLDNILQGKVLWSDAKRIELGMDCEIVGMSKIKQRRLEELEVKCYPGTMVGDYVPFYFCPRSIMLYILHQGNHPDITYHGGQGPILHLQADLQATIDWANNNNLRWAYSDINAGTYCAQFYNDPGQIDDIINWPAVNATDWRDAEIQEYKQAEFLTYESFPWELVEKVGVCNNRVRQQVLVKLGDVRIPEVCVESDWYY